MIQSAIGSSGLAADRPAGKAVDAAGDVLPPGIRWRMGSTRLWQTWLSALRFTPDGKQLLSLGGGSNGVPRFKETCKLWDVKTGKLLKTLPGSAFPVAISSDARWWVSYSDGNFNVKDGIDGNVVHRFGLEKAEPARSEDDTAAANVSCRGCRPDNVFSTTVADDNKTLVVLTTDRRVCRCDLESGKELDCRQYALLDRRDCADEPTPQISPDGRLLVGVLRQDWFGDKTPIPLRFWDVATGDEARDSLPAGDNFYECRWTADGQELIVTTRGSNYEVWDLKTGMRKATFKGSRNYNPVVTPDGLSELISSFEHVSRFDLATGKYSWGQEVSPYVRGPGMKGAAVNRYAFSPDGKTAAVGANCGRIVFIDWRTGKYVEGSTKRFGCYKEGYFDLSFDETISLSPDGSYLLADDAMTSEEDTVICDARTGRELRRKKGQEVLAWSPNGTQLASLVRKSVMKDDGSPSSVSYLQLTEAATGREFCKTAAAPDDIQFSPDGKTITYRERATVHMVDTKTGRSSHVFRLPADEAKNAYPTAISPDGKLVIVRASENKEVQLWGLDGQKKWSWSIPPDWNSWQARFLNSERLAIATAGKGAYPGVVRVVDAATGHLQREIPSSGSIAATSPDGGTVAVHHGKDEYELINVKTGRTVYRFQQAFVFRANKVEFSRDGKWFAFFRSEDTVEVRDAATGAFVNELKRPGYYVRSIAFASDSRAVAVTFNDCTIWMWNAIEDKPKQE